MQWPTPSTKTSQRGHCPRTVRVCATSVRGRDYSCTSPVHRPYSCRSRSNLIAISRAHIVLRECHALARCTRRTRFVEGTGLACRRAGAGTHQSCPVGWRAHPNGPPRYRTVRQDGSLGRARTSGSSARSSLCNRRPRTTRRLPCHCTRSSRRRQHPQSSDRLPTGMPLTFRQTAPGRG